MSLHTGIVPNKEIDVSELNLAKKKYVDDGLKLKVDKAGDTISGPLSMNDGKIWDLSSGTLDTNAVNKKYVDDQDNLRLPKTGGSLFGELSMDDNKITDLAAPTTNADASNKEYVDNQVSEKITDIDVVDDAYSVSNAEQTTYALLNTTRSEIKKLETSNVSDMIEKHFHFAFGGTIKGFGFTSGRALVAYGGFNSVSGRCTFARLKLRGMGYVKALTKIQLLGSPDTTSRLQGANITSTDALTGTYRNGEWVIPVGHHHFSNMTYLCLYMEGSTGLTTMYFDLYLDLALE